MQTEESTLAGFLGQAGAMAWVGLLLGLVVMALGLRAAIRPCPLRHAQALFAAAWLPLPLAFLGQSLGFYVTLREIIALGPALTPKDFAGGALHVHAAATCGALGLLFGLVGAVAALAWSREDAA